MPSAQPIKPAQLGTLRGRPPAAASPTPEMGDWDHATLPAPLKPTLAGGGLS